MKKLVLLLLVVGTFTSQSLFAQYKDDGKLIEGSADNRYARVEAVTVYTITARKRSKSPTWAIIENDGKPTGAMGYLKKGSMPDDTLEYANTYLIGLRKVRLPKAYFSMKDSILLNYKLKKVECVIIDISQKYAEKSDNLLFGKDSVTTNTIPPYKKIREFSPRDTSVVWKEDGYSSLAIHSYAIDYSDTTSRYVYGVAIKTTDGIIHVPLWTDVKEEWHTLKDRFYSVDASENNHFSTKEGDVFFDDKPIESLIVVRNE